MKDIILKAENLYFSYDDEKTHSLNGLSLEIERGKKIAFMGANGSGKSTFFLCCNGINRPAKGRILLDGEPIQYTRQGLLNLRQKVGIVFQDPDNQLFSASVYQEISFGILNLGVAEEEAKKEVEQVIDYLEKLRMIAQYLGVSDCKLQEGSMRADVNLSLRRAGSQEFGTRTEMKNLNSFKAIRRAIENEQERQAELLDAGKPVEQETRRWDDNKEFSRAMRSKEDAKDYRYFPDPDLPPVLIPDEWIQRVRNSLPEFQEEKAQRYIREYQLSAYDAGLLTESRKIAALFEETAALSGKPKKAANWLIGETLRLLREKNMDPEQLNFSPEHLAALIRLAEDGSVNNQVAKKVFEKIFEEDIDPVAYVEEHGLKTVSDTGMLEEAARRVIAANADAVEQYRQGKEKILGFLIGQLMRETKGQADPSLAGKILRSLL